MSTLVLAGGLRRSQGTTNRNNNAFSWLCVAAIVVGFVALLLGAMNHSQSAGPSLAQQLQAAIAAEPTTPQAATVAPLFAPIDGAQAFTLDQGVTLALPAAGPGETTDGSVIYDAASTSAAHVALQEVSGGTRALLHLGSASAPEAYAFQVDGNVSRLGLQPDGSVRAVGQDGSIVGVFQKPWARDGVGRSVPTHYEVNGTTLTQVIDHQNAGFEYGIVADPLWVPVALAVIRCQTHPYCRWLLNKNFWQAVQWAIRNLF